MTFFFPGRKEAQFFSGLLLLQKKKKFPESQREPIPKKILLFLDKN
jgi:hypothetical protein